MSGWLITSWLGVLVLTIINIFIFIKLKNISEQMLQMTFPGAKNMKDAMDQMQSMVKNIRRRGGKRRGGPFASMQGTPPGVNPNQLKAAMSMLEGLKKKKK